jgi:hypothetical protein
MVLPEAPRDQLETTFTPMLRRAFEALPAMLAIAFVDKEGECIDYVSAIDPYDIKVSAAHAFILVDGLVVRAEKLGLSFPFALELAAEQRSLCVRRMCEEYVAVALVAPDADRSKLEHLMGELSREFRSEAGIEAPPWDRSRGLEVIVRSAVGWDYAPQELRDGGLRVAVTDVLGRWTEPMSEEGGQDEVVCFRVRTQDGQEITLVHDPSGDGWLVRP